ncbi:hypothetical protein BWR60_18635 [Inquilinus limosus]|uniref:Proteophosphoglycan n=1 Tax=Inquilinus limosus TaxID=171674 RepID=A0A211ZK46_9PROT|nr:hypothetical protein BWR60_18635 [Inquilinus limosus]
MAELSDGESKKKQQAQSDAGARAQPGAGDVASALAGARREPTVADEAYDIRIGRDGTWYYHGSPIRRLALVKLFATVLRRDVAGDYWLITPAERGRITVDDAPFVAVAVDVTGRGEDQVLTFRTNLDHVREAGPEHPIRVTFAADTGEPSPYIRIAEGLDALLSRPVFYELAEIAVSHDGRMGVWSHRTFFPLDQA